MANSIGKREIVGLVATAIVFGALSHWSSLPPILSFFIGALVGAMVMAADLLWIAYCTWFWPSRLKKNS